MNVMEEEGKIMKVEKSSFHQVGYVPSQACAVSQSDSSRLISPHRGTVNPPLLIWLNHDSHLNSAKHRRAYPLPRLTAPRPPLRTAGGECKIGCSFYYLTHASGSHKTAHTVLWNAMAVCAFCVFVSVFVRRRGLYCWLSNPHALWKRCQVCRSFYEPRPPHALNMLPSDKGFMTVNFYTNRQLRSSRSQKKKEKKKADQSKQIFHSYHTQNINTTWLCSCARSALQRKIRALKPNQKLDLKTSELKTHYTYNLIELWLLFIQLWKEIRCLNLCLLRNDNRELAPLLKKKSHSYSERTCKKRRFRSLNPLIAICLFDSECRLALNPAVCCDLWAF